MHAYLKAEGTVKVMDGRGKAVIEFSPMEENGDIVGKLPFMVGKEVLAAINECYRFWGYPEVPSYFAIV